jgi:hypothetical protein
MKISGFTIIRNAIINDYPVVEAIASILPLVDELVVLVGDCEDDTRQLISSIGDPKIRIFDSVWDKTLRKGGEVLAVETNKALRLIDPASTWAFYLQADEAVHEKDHGAIRAACLKYRDDERVEGLLFRYLHFYGTYQYVGDSRKWYTHEVRIIRNTPAIQSYKDAQGFRVNGKRKLRVKAVDADIYHYGWVKSPVQMKRKMNEVARYWNPDLGPVQYNPEDLFDFSAFDSLEQFKGSHPAVYQRRIAAQNWQVALDMSKKKMSFKDFLLYRFEKMTGVRLFDFRNYKRI